MIVQLLDGHSLSWNPRGKEYLFDSIRGSKLHQSARRILKKKLYSYPILEEVSIPVEKRKTLYLDFYIPRLKVAIEVQGAQHYSFSSKFHEHKRDFLKQVRNDRKKQEWCDLNDIKLIILKFDEINQWEKQI